jgi:hypothetical protein
VIALANRGDIRSRGECLVPEGLVRFVRLEAKLEGDSTPDKACQHQHDRDVERAQQHRISEWEYGKQARAAKGQPGLVAIPDRRDRVHHRVAVVPVASDERKQDADAEVEAVHDHVHHQPKGNDDRPDDRKIDAHRNHSLPLGADSVAGSNLSGTAESGRAGLPSGASASPGVPSCPGPWATGSGPLATSLSM